MLACPPPPTPSPPIGSKLGLPRLHSQSQATNGSPLSEWPLTRLLAGVHHYSTTHPLTHPHAHSYNPLAILLTESAPHYLPTSLATTNNQATILLTQPTRPALSVLVTIPHPTPHSVPLTHTTHTSLNHPLQHTLSPLSPSLPTHVHPPTSHPDLPCPALPSPHHSLSRSPLSH